ncbi:MAG: long-chain fatty acid--CoA ligase [bacterium]|nr:long-chain fatty acid--CoA ligase [bacterium]
MKELDNIGDIIEFLEEGNKRYGDKTALQIKDGKEYRKISYVELGNRAIDVSSTLIKFGIQKGDRVAIISENRPEWAVAFFGIISCGGIVVPLDVRLKEKELTYILNDCGAEYVFVSSDFVDVIKNIQANVKKIISLDEGDEDVLSLKELKYTEGEPEKRKVALEDTAVIIYTSGTTGNPKGVELTYKNLFFQVFSFNKLLKYDFEDNFLSILPLNHVLELTCSLLTPLHKGVCITYLQTLKPTEIISTMKETKTTVMIVVPLILQLFYRSIMKEVEKSPEIKRLFQVSLNISKLSGGFGNIRKVLFKKIHAGFGGRLKCFISGGAPLDPKLATNFRLMGIPVLQGYGLTETSPVISVNTLQKNRIGSVGKPLEGVKVKISDEGEILTRGPHLMKGYFRDLVKTQEAIKDGWFHTGDIGEIDKDGFLYIKGRIKNLIISAGGKKIHPEEVEEELLKSPYIKEICVLGKKDKRGGEEVYAVVVPDYDYVKGTDKEIRKIIDDEIKEYGQNLADYKRVVDFEIWQEELPKTSTRKIKRKEVVERVKIGWCP